MRSKGRGSVSSRTTRAGGSEVRTTTLKSSSITISPETFSGSFHILAQNGWGFPLMRRLPPRSKMSALIVCSRQCTSLRGQLESMAPRFRHSVFPCFIATTQRLLASSSTFPTCTFEACCFLRLHPKHSNSTTTPWYLKKVAILKSSEVSISKGVFPVKKEPGTASLPSGPTTSSFTLSMTSSMSHVSSPKYGSEPPPKPSSTKLVST
mmetsp:Transcript_51062/g.101104  ORF Transcript_51062/g.101104 Transcript_51062/m.101104 type:complete len:208 (+) Transcript_51062:285-908(+)